METLKLNEPLAMTLTSQDGEDCIMIIPDEDDRPLVFIKMRPSNIIRLAQECSAWVFEKAYRDS